MVCVVLRAFDSVHAHMCALRFRESEMDSLLAKTNERLSETRRTLADTERVGASRTQATHAWSTHVV